MTVPEMPTKIAVTVREMVGEVIRFHVRDSIIDKDMLIDPEKLKPVARLGGPSYSRIRDRFDMLRPVVKK